MDVIAPRITTDRSVATHSLEAIVAGVCRAGMGDEEKAIALYEYTRRVMFHYRERSERVDEHFDLDPLRLINTYGYSFCTQQMMVLVALWQAAGIESRIWGMPGHGTAQAFYGGKHHWFDPLIGAYVRSRTDGTVASLAEIAEDPTVLTQAAAEGRAAPTFLPCGRVFYEDVARLVPRMAAYIAECRRLGDDMGFIAARAGQSKPTWNPRQPLYQPDWSLRVGERVVFLWDNLEGEYNCIGVNPEHLPPHHWCGVEVDRRDRLNYPCWKPYAKTINGVRTCRYHANGLHVFAPKFRDEWFKRGFEASSLEWHCWKRGMPKLRLKKRRRAADLIYKMSTPHVYTSATLAAEFRRAARDDVSRLHVSCDGGATWVKVWDAKAGRPGKVEAEVELRDHVRGMRDFWVRAQCRTRGEPDKAGLDSLSVRAVFQHNMFARPYLVPGRNRVTVRVANPEVLPRLGLDVTYAWREGRAARSHTERITESPATFTIHVGGRAMPRMRRLEMKVGKGEPT
ncbi:MAG TPA: hypothetical protein VNE39_11655 [Planctomycetota bacterium]|nr:hypothetical protein [Planctomycetota bacterium]